MASPRGVWSARALEARRHDEERRQKLTPATTGAPVEELTLLLAESLLDDKLLQPDFHDRLVAQVEQADTPFVAFASTRDILDLKVAAQVVSLLKESGTPLATCLITHRSDLGSETAPGFSVSHKRNQNVVEVHDEGLFFHDLDVHNKIFARDFLLRVLSACRLEADSWVTVLGLAALREAGFISISSGALVRREHPTESAEVRRHLSSRSELRRRTGLASDGRTALEHLGRPDLGRAWDLFVLGHVYGELYPLAPRVGDDYWAELQAGVAEAAAGLTTTELSRLPIHTRLLAHLTAAGEREDVEAISYFRSDHGSSVAVDSSDGALRFRPHYLPELRSDIPPELLAAQVADLSVRTSLLRYDWDEDGALSLTGWAYVPGVDPVSAGVVTSLVVTEESTGAVTTVPVEQYVEPRVDLDSSDRFISYAGAAFRATVPREVFLPPGAPVSPGNAEWSVGVRLEWRAHTVTAPITARDTSGQAGFLWNDRLRDGCRLVATFSRDVGLKLKLSDPPYVLEDLSLCDRELELTVTTRTTLVADHLRIANDAAQLSTKAPLVKLEGLRATYRASLPAVPPTSQASSESEWTVRAVSSLFGELALAWPGRDDSLNHLASGRLWAETTGFGYLRLKERRSRILVSTVEVAEDGRHLQVEGTCDFEAYHGLRIALMSGTTAVFAETAVTVTSDGSPNTFTARIPLWESRWGQDETTLESGGYSLRYLTPSGTLKNSHWILFARQHTQPLPEVMEFDGGTVEVSRTLNNAAVKIDLRPPMTASERSLCGQQTLQQEFFDTGAASFGDATRLRDEVLVQCYGGRKVTDSPLELSQRIRRDHPGVPVYWATVDCSTAIPDGTERVIIGTRAYYERLATARVLINNNNFPHYFRKRPGQYYLQTWHGTALKRLVFDVDRSSFSLSYWALMDREATYWDHLLAQNDYSEKVFSSAFRYPGPFITEGYPRNDSLVDDDAPARRQATRELLGIGKGTKVVLYAPTWRDNVKSSRSQYAMVTYLDFEKFGAGAGSDWLVLFRGHHNIAAGRKTKDLAVLDVTDYPEVNDLYLAADVLVTDYSSVMFDFACTGKPILYLSPDLATYSESVRGFYFDLEADSPGPLLTTTSEVVDAVRNLDLVQVRYARRYAAFRERFVARDDGQATTRVYAQLPLGDLLAPR